MKQIIITPEIYSAAPGFRELYIEADVVNGETQDELFAMIEAQGERLRGLLTIPEIAQRPAIAATRAAYKALGKEPNRYRPSAEALHRRMLQGKGLYRITALVDIINLLSLRYGYSIGGFDADKITGPVLTLGVGREGEPFEAIGRGALNIACLPIFRDETGGVGTPTSDNERTKMTLATRRLAMTVNIYGEATDAAGLTGREADFLRDATSLLETYVQATNIRHQLIEP